MRLSRVFRQQILRKYLFRFSPARRDENTIHSSSPLLEGEG
jgi:hypothetical protein